MFFARKPKIFFYVGVLFTLVFLLPALLYGQSVLSEKEPAQGDRDTVFEMKEFDEYLIKYHANEKEEKDVLLIYSVSEDSRNRDAELVNLSNFRQILESHWKVNISFSDYRDLNELSIPEYPYYIFVELYDSTEAAQLFEKIMLSSTSSTMWIGCGSHNTTWDIHDERIFSDILLPDDISEIRYKNVGFKIDDTFRVCDPLPEESDRFETLSTFVTKDGIEYPLVGKFNGRNIFVTHTVPFSYKISTYSLPFLDVFHSFFGHHENNEAHPALMRLEDVNVYTYDYPRKLRAAFKHLRKNDIPYHIAFIEYYLNPPEGIEMHSYKSARFLNTIKYAIEHDDAVLVQHGYTHQVGDEISGIGFEFWDAQTNSPLLFATDENANRYALQKAEAAQEAMITAGLPIPDIWETPHYALSVIDNAAIDHIYPLRFEHIQIIGSLPFVAEVGGSIYFPENLGYIFDSKTQIEEKRILLEQLNTFEDPVASVFWHPWRDTSELKELTSLIQSQGFSFVSAYDLVERSRSQLPITVVRSNLGLILLTDFVLYIVFISFILGALLYTRNIYNVRKHFKAMHGTTITMATVRTAALQNNKPLPRLALFIPARNEGLVIANTLRRIANVEYPKDKVRVYVITDERELDDHVEQYTKDIAKQVAEELHRTHGHNFIEIVEVPEWYSGVYGDNSATYERSTKGRALNYCLQVLDTTQIDMIGILDADGRLHQDVLKEVALKRITDDSNILQGPVFQVSNFKNVNIIGKIAGLELALHHLTELPARLKRKDSFQFLAGTNYFIDTTCIVKAGGWDQTALVEDAELALRLYSKDHIVGEWLNAPELEQTPANFSVYRRQRERWVRGHLQLIHSVREARLPLRDKIYIYHKIFFSQFRFLFDIGLPLLSIYLMFAGAYAYIDPIFGYLSVILFVASMFIWDTYGFIFRTISGYIGENMSVRDYFLYSLIFILFLPIFIIVQAIPRIEALYNYFMHPKKKTWYKTERTVEAAIN